MEQYHDDSILDPPEPVGLRQKKTGRVRWVVPVLLLLTLAAAAVLLWPKESAPTAEDQDPAPAWETNYLMTGERIPLEGSTMEEQMENAAKHPVLGSKLTRDQIRSVTFLDSLDEIPSSAWDVSAVGNGSVMAWTKLNDGLYDLYIAAEGGVSAAHDCSDLFAGYSNAKTINFGEAFHTTGAADMSRMFFGCKALTELNLNRFDTSAVQDMNHMFYWCAHLRGLTLGDSFDTSAVQDMNRMFCRCKSLTKLTLGDNFVTTNADTEDMFYDCPAGADYRHLLN